MKIFACSCTSNTPWALMMTDPVSAMLQPWITNSRKRHNRFTLWQKAWACQWHQPYHTIWGYCPCFWDWMQLLLQSCCSYGAVPTVHSKILPMLHHALSAAAVQHTIRSVQADPVTVQRIDQTRYAQGCSMMQVQMFDCYRMPICWIPGITAE